MLYLHNHSCSCLLGIHQHTVSSERSISSPAAASIKSSSASSSSSSYKRARFDSHANAGSSSSSSTIAKFVDAVRHVTMQAPLSVLLYVFHEIFDLLNTIDVYPAIDSIAKYLPQSRDILIHYHRQLAILLVMSKENPNIIDASDAGISAAKHGQLPN
jgi:hypothetical protein